MTQDNNLLDINLLSDYLTQQHIDLGKLHELSKFSDGQSNPTFKLVADSGTYVLRIQPEGELLKSAHQVDREFRVMDALGETDVPVPRMIHLAEKENPFGRLFFLMEFLDGRIFWDPALSELAADQNEKRGRIYDAMNDSLAKLHSVDPVAIGLETFGKPGNYFERQLSRWSKQYLSSEVERNEDIHWLIDWLEKNLPRDDGQNSLVHGDYRLDNMIFKSSSEEVAGILDWELSTLGHPLSDLAYQCMQWRLPNTGSFRGLGGVDRQSLGIPDEKEYVAKYCERRNIEKIDNWFFYLAFSFFRLAAILQGVYKRSLDGNASNPERAKTYGMAVPVLCSLAISMIKEEG